MNSQSKPKTVVVSVETAKGEDAWNTWGHTFNSIEDATAWLENNGGGVIKVEDVDGDDWDFIAVGAEETTERITYANGGTLIITTNADGITASYGNDFESTNNLPFATRADALEWGEECANS